MTTTIPAPEQATEPASPISTKLARAALDLGIDFETVTEYLKGSRAYNAGLRYDED